MSLERMNYWSHTPDNLRDDCLIEEIECMIDYLEARGDVFKKLTASGARCEIFVGLSSETSTGEEFTSSLLLRLGLLGIGLSVDFFVQGSAKDNN